MTAYANCVCDCHETNHWKYATGPRAVTIVRGFEEGGIFTMFWCYWWISYTNYCPNTQSHNYYNRKGFHSIVLQALVDHLYRILNVYVGWFIIFRGLSKRRVWNTCAQSYSDIEWGPHSYSDLWRSSISLVTMATKALSWSGCQWKIEVQWKTQ